MRINLVYSLMLVLPLTVYSACSSDDSTSDGTGGGGTSSGGRGGSSSGGRGGANPGIGDAGASNEAGSGGAPVPGDLAGAAGTDVSAGAGGAEQAGAAGDGGSGGAVALLSNTQVVQVLTVANQGEVAAGQLALAGAQMASVKTFAQAMVTEHSAANTQVLGVVATKHIAPEPSPVSEMLQAEATKTLATLSQTPAARFDRVYMESQVMMHQEVLALIDSTLLPSSTDADLTALLTTLRAAVATHLMQAEAIVAML